MVSKKPELLAPAGTMESLIAAVENGADAVYLGARTLGARAYAGNFSNEELKEAIDYAHLRGVKVYVTMNTLLRDEEFRDAVELLHHLDVWGADAIIVQDVGLFSLIREKFPELPVHASTQLTIQNTEGVRLFQRSGVRRVVLAREMSLEQIRTIKQHTNMQIEVFVHGALCISYSGQCLMSSMIGGRSGNRGHCAQPCRREYHLLDKGREVPTDGEYLLNPRDLNTASLIPQLVEAGIDSFKIEGRMKRPEYVAAVVQVYRQLIDRYMEDPAGYYVSEDEATRLGQLFNRGFTDAYLRGNTDDMMNPLWPYNRGVHIGDVISHDRRKGRLRVRLIGELEQGDGISIGVSFEAGDSVRALYHNGVKVDLAGPGAVVDIPFSTSIRAGVSVYRTRDRSHMNALEKTFTSGSPIRTVPVNITATARVGSVFELEMEDVDHNRVQVRSDWVVEQARKRPMSGEQVRQQLTKLGDTVFEVGDVSLSIEGDVFIPIRHLNDMRKEAISQLESKRLSRWRRADHEWHIEEDAEPQCTYHQDVSPYLAVSVNALSDLRAALAGGADVIYFGGEHYRGTVLPDIRQAMEACKGTGCQLYIATPRIVNDEERASVEHTLSLAGSGCEGVVVSNHGVLAEARRQGLNVIADSPLNVFNRRSLIFMQDMGVGTTVLSQELTLEQIAHIAECGPVECVVEGRTTVMVSKYCMAGDILSQGETCSRPCESSKLEIVDAKGYAFPLRMDDHCRMHVLNSRRLCMLDHLDDLVATGIAGVRIEARADPVPDLEALTRAYRNALDGNDRPRCSALGTEPTTGHYYRGVL
ncbi:MAG: DUF3656 domain-containing protein [Euryarchaeota archaeon]|nr:DUF3656 domain-containing protein [Euryarchaeota archaeon]